MRALLAGALLTLATPALAQERDYCPERPGLDTPACITPKGHVSVEMAFGDWTLDRQPDQRTDTVLIGDTLVRVGVTDTLEARVGWTPFGHVRERDRPSGAIDRADRVGDVTLGLKASLHDPDGKGLSVAVLPQVSLPLGRSPVGAGDWGAGVLLPVTYELNDTFSLDLAPELDAAVDEDGDGRHLAYSATAGLQADLGHHVSLTGEAQVLRDRDPAQHTTQALAALSLAWLARDDLQFDVFAAQGLDHAAPDHEIYAGISRRF